MKGLAITNKGIEDVCAVEIKEIIGAETKIHDSCVEFEFEKEEDLFLLCYKSQSVSKVMLLLNSFKAKSIDEIKANTPDVSEWVNKDLLFVVKCKSNNEKFIAPEVEEEVGAVIIDKIKAKVSFKTPQTRVLVFIAGDDCHIGIDFSADDLGKREYRVFTGHDTIKATTAYALAKLSGFKEGSTLIDPFCFSGTILIESALYSSNFPVNFFSKDRFFFEKLKKFEEYDFDSFFDKIDQKIKKKTDSKIYAIDEAVNAITAAKKNAKIAGVNKHINFSRKETGWLELKFDKNSVDCIATHPPGAGKHLPENQAEKIYDELFWQAEHILKKDGRISVLTKCPELIKKAAENHKFKTADERKIMQGKQEMSILVFRNL